MSVPEFLRLDAPLLDVRSPSEFLRGHIPGATSFPLFTDAERASVGTTYKLKGRDQAVLEGLGHVGPRLAQMATQAIQLAPEGRVRVHCWRGGERSASVAWLLARAGLKQVGVLKGGYKAFRRHVLECFDTTTDLRVLGGYTGSGKTLLLKDLAAQGEQVIDLEAMACHKGSSFGALGQPAQPTTEHFENLLWAALDRMDASRPIWVEDESLMIGRVKIPEGFHAQMRKAPLVFVEIPVAQRAQRLVEEYGGFSQDELAAALQRISKRLGPQHCKAALEALEQDDLLTVALITLRYYDKAYARGLADRDHSRIAHISLSAIDAIDLRDQLKVHARAIA